MVFSASGASFPSGISGLRTSLFWLSLRTHTRLEEPMGIVQPPLVLFYCLGLEGADRGGGVL